MRSDALYLQDIVDAVRAIANFLVNTSHDEFLSDDLRQSAVLQKLSIIGEAATRISDRAKAMASGVPWQKITGFRNIAVHAYFSVDWEIVWTAATVNAPDLLAMIRPLLDAEGIEA
jgi:uncharacterized protein with HEPN domain